MASDSRMTMMLMTTISSIRVKPRCRERCLIESSPGLVLRAIQASTFGLGVNVEDVVSAPGVRVRIILHGTHSPLILAGHGVNRDVPQEAHLLTIGIDTLDQGIEIGRVA